MNIMNVMNIMNYYGIMNSRHNWLYLLFSNCHVEP